MEWAKQEAATPSKSLDKTPEHGKPNPAGMGVNRDQDMPELVSDNDDNRDQPTGGAKKKKFATKKPIADNLESDVFFPRSKWKQTALKLFYI